MTATPCHFLYRKLLSWLFFPPSMASHRQDADRSVIHLKNLGSGGLYLSKPRVP